MILTTARRAALLLALLTGILPASPEAQYSVAFGEGLRESSGISGDYRFAARLRAEWIELVREIPFDPAFSLGLGVHLGGPRLRLRTVASPGTFAGHIVDSNRWLSLDARLEFHAIQPYARLRYSAGREDRGFRLRLDAGLRLLVIEELSIALGGPMAAGIADRGRLLDEFEREVRAGLDEYYVEPVLRFELNYRFG